MIKEGYKYKAYNPVVRKEKFIFQVSDKGRDGEYRFASFMVNLVAENESLRYVQHKEDLEIVSITGLALSEFNGKMQTTIFGDVKRLANNEVAYEEIDVQAIIEEGELPF